MINNAAKLACCTFLLGSMINSPPGPLWFEFMGTLVFTLVVTLTYLSWDRPTSKKKSGD